MIDTLELVVIAFFLAIFINQSFPVFSLPKEKIDASLGKKNYESSPCALNYEWSNQNCTYQSTPAEKMQG